MTTVAGAGTSGFADGPVASAQPSDTGPRVAFANFAYVAGVRDPPRHSQHMVADFRDTVWLSYEALSSAGRIAAADHDARAALIRRELYYRFRWLDPMDEVRDAEAVRMRDDAYVQGPRPSWASPPSR